jgi:hypothetical protein
MLSAQVIGKACRTDRTLAPVAHTDQHAVHCVQPRQMAQWLGNGLGLGFSCFGHASYRAVDGSWVVVVVGEQVERRSGAA